MSHGRHGQLTALLRTWVAQLLTILLIPSSALAARTPSARPTPTPTVTSARSAAAAAPRSSNTPEAQRTRALEEVLSAVPAANRNSCLPALQAVQASCCTLDIAATAPSGPAGQIENFQYQDCETGEPQTIQCTRTPISSSAADIEKQLKEVQKDATPTPACTAALRSPALASCGRFEPEKLCSVTTPVAGSGKAYVPCSVLEGYQRSAGGNLCDPWKFARDKLGKQEIKVFAVDPDSTSFDFYPRPSDARPNPAVSRTPPSTLLPQEVQERAAFPLRIEIPGNFLRYFIERIGLASIFTELQRQASLPTDDPARTLPPGISCDPGSLSCQLNPIKMAKTAQLLNGIQGNGQLQVAARETANGAEIRLVRFSSGPISLAGAGNWVNELSNQVLEGQEDRGGPDMNRLRTDYRTTWADFRMEGIWAGRIELSPVNGDVARIDLGGESRLGLLPTHAPVSENGYRTQLPEPHNRSSYLDRVGVVTGLSKEFCSVLQNARTPNQVPMNGTYLTFQNPYLCSCNRENPTQNFCVYDSYPREQKVTVSAIYDGERNNSFDWDIGSHPFDNRIAFAASERLVAAAVINGVATGMKMVFPRARQAQVNAYATGPITPEQLSRLKFGEASCSDPIWMNVPSGRNAPDQAQREARMTLATWGRTVAGLSDRTLAGVRSGIMTMGCASASIPITALGPQRESGAVQADGFPEKTIGRWTGSATGLELDTKLHLGKYQAREHHGFVIVIFDTTAEAQKMLKKTWWGRIIHFVVKIIWTLISAIVSLIANVPYQLATNVLDVNAVIVSLGDVFIRAHSLVSAAPVADPNAPAGVTSLLNSIDVKARRLVSTVPRVEKIGFNKFEFNAPACNVAENFTRIQGPLDFIEWLLTTVVGCPLQSFGQLVQFTMQPIKMLFLKLDILVFEIVSTATAKINTQIVNNVSQMESSFELLGLMNLAAKKVVKEPGVFWQMDPAQEDSINAQAPIFGHLCALSRGTEKTSCLLAKLLASEGTESHINIFLTRQGAKAHYRALEGLPQFDANMNPLLSFESPPVAFCVPGDNPFGPRRPDLTEDEMKMLTNFREIDPVSDDVARSPSSRARALGFREQCASFSDLMVAGTLQNTSFETALIPTQRSNLLINEVFTCPDSFSCALTQRNIEERADSAGCSLFADLWVREKVGGSSTQDYRHLLTLLSQQASPERRRAVSGLARVLGSTVQDLDQKLTDLSRDCLDRLRREGFTKVGATLPVRDLDEVARRNVGDDVLRQRGIIQ